jgi:DNA-binding transcriptional LysR family regulator
MMDQDITSLDVFMDVSAHRSFRRAADARGVSPSSLSHAIRVLETTLGVRLLHRTTRSVALTEAGAAFRDRVAPALQEIRSAIDDLGDYRDRVSGTLRINAPAEGAQLLLNHVIPMLQTRHPGLNVDIVVEGGLIDIVAEGFDAGIRLLDSIPMDMISVPLTSEIRFGPVASPDYLAKAGRPETPDALLSHECICIRLPSGKPYRWEFVRHGKEIRLDVPGRLTLNDNRLMAEAAVSGLGIAYLPHLQIRELLNAGRLVSLLDDWTQPSPGLHLYYSSGRYISAGLRALIDTARASLRDEISSVR